VFNCHKNCGRCIICRLSCPWKLIFLSLFFAAATLAASAQNFVTLWDYTNQTPYTTGDPLPVSGANNPLSQTNITSITGSVPNASTAIALTAASTHLVVKTDPAAAVLYVNLANGTATASNFRIDPGGSITLDGLPSISSIKILGASATGTYSVAAW